ncbi:MAG: hypothetical protein ACSLFP_10495 [Acidimicrobiales bacterium]
MSHLVIAGTGRAGTTHLVRWLGDQGCDIGAFGDGDWHEDAKAGLERRLTGDGLPYVVKDPWLHTYLGDVDPTLIDVLVVPVRDLAGAVESRLANERRAIQRAYPGWSAETWGATPGGMIHRIDAQAQADVLASGFYELLQWAVAHDVTLVLLDFARIGDEEYLRDRLGWWLPTPDVAEPVWVPRGECTSPGCGIEVHGDDLHVIASVAEDDGEIGIEGGGSGMVADFCAEHCPGGCRSGCARATVPA